MTYPRPVSADAQGQAVLHIYEDRQGNVRLLTPGGLAHYRDGALVVDVPVPEMAGLAVWGA